LSSSIFLLRYSFPLFVCLFLCSVQLFPHGRTTDALSLRSSFPPATETSQI
jgi:hypothetical protein